MRNRLLKLLDEAINDESTSYSNIVDYLLENGVIVPPCKVGDTAYQIFYTKKGDSRTAKETVVGVHIIDAPNRHGHKREKYIITYNENTNSIRHINFNKIGKSVFLTREEAEAKLKGEQ